jgi:aryl-alcohol dehydrogenase-like predicted oxidoreductase
LETGWQQGIQLLDTAPAYGASEKNLGRALTGDNQHSWRVMTKTLPLGGRNVTAEDIARVDQTFVTSLDRLGCRQVDALLVHHAQDLLAPGGDALYHWLQTQKAQDRTRRIGVSAYGSDEIEALLQRYRIDLIQLPANIADQRLLHDGTVAALVRAGVQIHVRSLYLQGALLANQAFFDQRFPGQAAWARDWMGHCQDIGATQLQACLGFFLSRPEFSVAVVGATSGQEITATLDAWRDAPLTDWSAWALDAAEFIDPRMWARK